MIEVKPVDETSFYRVLNLTVAEPDQPFVASNARSLAECWLYRDNGMRFGQEIKWLVLSVTR